MTASSLVGSPLVKSPTAVPALRGSSISESGNLKSSLSSSQETGNSRHLGAHAPLTLSTPHLFEVTALTIESWLHLVLSFAYLTVGLQHGCFILHQLHERSSVKKKPKVY